MSRKRVRLAAVLVAFGAMVSALAVPASAFAQRGGLAGPPPALLPASPGNDVLTGGASFSALAISNCPSPGCPTLTLSLALSGTGFAGPFITGRQTFVLPLGHAVSSMTVPPQSTCSQSVNAAGAVVVTCTAGSEVSSRGGVAAPLSFDTGSVVINSTRAGACVPSSAGFAQDLIGSANRRTQSSNAFPPVVCP